jgi:REP element-mobilizing transposase RayT
MPREPRDIEPGATYHLISRFVDRDWFIQLQREREHYLELLGRSIGESRWQLLAFAIMSNHVHLAAVAAADPLHAWIRRVHAPFADAMNRAYDRIGPMFVRGPKAYLVENRDVGNLIAYIHNNPVRAGVVRRADESTWTSHRAYVGASDVPPWLQVRRGLELVGVRDASDFDAWVTDPAREANKEEFTEDAHERALARSRAAKAAANAASERPPATAIVSATAQVVGVPLSVIRSRSRGDAEVLARTVAVHCALSWGLTGPMIADALAMSQPGVSVIKRRALNDHALVVLATVQRVIAGATR